MIAEVHWGDIKVRDTELPDPWPGVLEAIKIGLQVFELNASNGYSAFAGAVNNDEKWGIALLWKQGDKMRPHVLKVYEGHEPVFPVELLRVGM